MSKATLNKCFVTLKSGEHCGKTTARDNSLYCSNHKPAEVVIDLLSRGKVYKTTLRKMERVAKRKMKNKHGTTVLSYFLKIDGKKFQVETPTPFTIGTGGEQFGYIKNNLMVLQNNKWRKAVKGTQEIPENWDSLIKDSRNTDGLVVGQSIKVSELLKLFPEGRKATTRRKRK